MSDSGIDSIVNNMTSDHHVFVIQANDLSVVAAAHLVIIGDVAELSLSVLGEHRKNGYGNKMMTHCITWCRNRSVKTIQMNCLRSNVAIKNLQLKHGMTIEPEGTDASATIDLNNPTISSIYDELVETQFAEFDHLNKVVANMFKLNFTL